MKFKHLFENDQSHRLRGKIAQWYLFVVWIAWPLYCAISALWGKK